MVLDKANFSSGPEINFSDDPNIGLVKLIETVDLLKGSLHNFDQVTERKYFEALQDLKKISETSFLQGVSNTRGITEQLYSDVNQHHTNLQKHYSDILNSVTEKNKPKRNQNLHKHQKESGQQKKHWYERVVEGLHSEVQKFSHPATHHIGAELSKTFNLESSATKYAADQLANVSIHAGESLTSVSSQIFQLKGVFETIAQIGGTLFLGVAGLGISSALEAIELDNNYRKMVYQSNPAAYKSITGTSTNKMDFREDMISSLLTTKSDQDVDSLYQSALSTRPGIGATDLDVQSMSLQMGLLQDIGVDKGVTTSLLTNLQHNLGMKIPESLGTVSGLTKTGLETGVDLGTYLNQVSEIGLKFRGMGFTISQVDGLFNKFMKKTFTGGVKLAADQAKDLVETQLGLQKSLSVTTAGLIGLSQGANLNVLGSPGLHGGSNIGQMMHSGDPVLAFAATQMMRQGANISGMYDAIASHYQQMVGLQNPSATHDEQMGRLYLMMQKEGSVKGDFSDTKVRALLDEILTHKKGSDNLRMKFAAVAPKPIPELFEELKKQTLLPELNQFHKVIEERANPLEGLGKLWQRISQMLGSVFLPAVEEISTIVAALGAFTKTFFSSKGNLLSASAAFSRKFNEISHEWQEANKVGTLKALIDQNSLTAEFLAKLGLLESHDPNKVMQNKFLQVMIEAATITEYAKRQISDSVGYTMAELSGANNKLSGGNKLFRDKYEDIARSAARRYGIPEQLFVNQITQESGWNPGARSGAGAVGIAQIVPRWHPGVNANNPEESLDYAAKLMKGHYLTYKKKGYDAATSYAMALSAYNSGAGNVAKYGTNIYKGGLKETTNYVSNIMGKTPNFGGAMSSNLSHYENSVGNSISSTHYNKTNSSIPVKTIINTTIKNSEGKIIGRKQVLKSTSV